MEIIRDPVVKMTTLVPAKPYTDAELAKYAELLGALVTINRTKLKNNDKTMELLPVWIGVAERYPESKQKERKVRRSFLLLLHTTLFWFLESPYLCHSLRRLSRAFFLPTALFSSRITARFSFCPTAISCSFF